MRASPHPQRSEEHLVKSIVWFAVGVAAGFVVAHQVNQTKQGREFFSSSTPRRSAFGKAIAEGYHERDAELRRTPRPADRRARADAPHRDSARSTPRAPDPRTEPCRPPTSASAGWTSSPSAATPSCPRPRSSPTTRRCCSRSPAWCRSCRTSRGSSPRRTRARRACRSASARTTSKRSARPRVTARSSR